MAPCPLFRCRPWLALRLHSSMTTNPNTPLPNKSSPLANPVTCFWQSALPKLPNAVHAAKAAKALGLRTIGLTGQDGGQLGSTCEIMIQVPASEVRGYRSSTYPFTTLFAKSWKTPFSPDHGFVRGLQAKLPADFHLWPSSWPLRFPKAGSCL